MKFIKELSDEQLTGLLLESDQLYISRNFGALPEVAREAADQPDFFWQRQHTAIWMRIRSTQRSAARAMVAFAGAALLLIVALIVKTGSRVEPVSPQPDPDQTLLISVERAVGSDVPAALEPAALLSDEIISGSRLPSAVHRQKESNNE